MVILNYFTKVYLFFPLITMLTIPIVNFDNTLFAAEENVVTNPKISIMCDELLKTRENRIILKQKAIALSKRIEKLRTQIPERKKTLIKKLEYISSRVDQQIELMNLQAKSLEENIVRRGCPGISI
ncbi:MAG: hypothetical protein HQK49_00545 [Oligoflexia bacterium]|nr:hypothetical protein [Oligoflexia bacterium]